MSPSLKHDYLVLLQAAPEHRRQTEAGRLPYSQGDEIHNYAACLAQTGDVAVRRTMVDLPDLDSDSTALKPEESHLLSHYSSYDFIVNEAGRQSAAKCA